MRKRSHPNTDRMFSVRDSALTDPLIAGIAKGSVAYKLIGTYVTTPLNWSVALSVFSLFLP